MTHSHASWPYPYPAFAQDEAEFLPSWCRLCRIMGAALQHWPAIGRITVYQGWFYTDDAEEVPDLR
jgi:hypothetical protein